MPVTFSSYRLGPGQRASYKTVPPPWDWLLRRENELGPRRSRSQITFAVLVPPLYVAVEAPALIVTTISEVDEETGKRFGRIWKKNAIQIMIFLPNYMWAENNKTQICSKSTDCRNKTVTITKMSYLSVIIRYFL